MNKVTGPAFIYQDNTKRFIGVKFSVKDRDLGSTIADAQERVNKNVKFSTGYPVGWTGEFEYQVRATKRLGQVVTISLIGISVLLLLCLATSKIHF